MLFTKLNPFLITFHPLRCSPCNMCHIPLPATPTEGPSPPPILLHYHDLSRGQGSSAPVPQPAASHRLCQLANSRKMMLALTTAGEDAKEEAHPAPAPPPWPTSHRRSASPTSHISKKISGHLISISYTPCKRHLWRDGPPRLDPAAHSE